MRIGLAGPIDLAPLQEWLPPEALRQVYSFPLTGHLAAGYRRAGHDVVVFAEASDSRHTEHHTGDGVEVWRIPQRQRARDRAADAWRKERNYLTAAMAQARCDVVHAHWTYEFALAALAAPTPALVTAHDWAPAVLAQHRDAYRLIRLAMQYRTLRKVRHLTAVSPYIADRVSRWARTDPQVIPNGVDVSWRRAAADLAPERRIVTAVNGNFERLKNVRVLLEAFALLRADDPHAELHLVGGDYGPGGPAARWARQTRTEDGVHFVGPVSQDELRRLLSRTSLFVHPSLEESFGMAVLEAAASGVPVLAHDQARGPAWILDGFPDSLTDCRVPAALARAMAMSLKSSALAPRATALQEAVYHRFSLGAVVDQYLRALDHAAGR